MMGMKAAMIIVLFPTCLFSQQSINGTQFYQKNMETTINNGKSDEVKDIIKFPLIEKIELRSETRDFDLKQQENTLRITPSSRKKKKSQQSILHHLREKPNFEWLKYQCDQMAETHEVWLKLYFLERKSILFKKIQQVQFDKQSLLNKKINSLTFETNDLIENEIDKNEIQNRLNSLQNKKELLLNIFDLGGYELDFEDFIDLETLLLRINDNFSQSSINQQKKSYEYELAEKEINLEIVEKNHLFDFIQMRYYGPQEEALKEHLSFGIGFILPLSGNRTLKIQELKLEQEQILFEQQLETMKLNQKLTELEKTIYSQYNNYIQLKMAFEDEKGRLMSLEKSILQQSETDMEPIFKIREKILKNELELADEEESIYESIINYLEDSEKLCAPPYRFILAN